MIASSVEAHRCDDHIRVTDSASTVALALRVLDQRDTPIRVLDAGTIAHLDLPSAGQDESKPTIRCRMPVGRTAGPHTLKANRGCRGPRRIVEQRPALILNH